MAEYRISGIWMDENDVITHYAVHTATYNKKNNNYRIGKAEKMTKNDAVDLLLDFNNYAKTYLWNYSKTRWESGADVHVIEGEPLYLRTVPDSTERDNLLHLINYGFVF